ncbi:MAG: MFS transporter [Polyangiaceae bacterium]|jgi:MFS family permease
MLAEAPKRARVPLPRTIRLLGWTSLFTDVGTEMIFPLLPVFLVETLHSGPAYLGLVEGAADTVASLLKLASGYVADATHRRKPLVLFGYGLASAVRPLVAFATHPWHVLAVRVCDRIGKGVRGTPRDALIADAAGDRAGRAFGFHQAMDNLGAVVGPMLATLLVASGWPVRRVFRLAIVPGIVATALVAVVREKPTTTHHDALAPRPATPRISQPLRLYLAILALFSLGNSSDAFLLLRARSLGLSTLAIPVLWALLNLSKVVWSEIGGNWADRAPRPAIIAGGWVVYAGVYLGMAVATAEWHAWALFAVYGIFYGLTEPVEKALVRDLAREDARGAAYGAYNFVVGVTALPAGVLMGWVWRAHGAEVALSMGAGLAALSCVLLLAWNVWRRSAVQNVGAG